MSDCIEQKRLATPTATATGQLQKDIDTQIATLALAGHAVHRGNIGDFTVCKFGLSKYCKDFAELQAFALKLGVH